jgi:hypothetical protein
MPSTRAIQLQNRHRVHDPQNLLHDLHRQRQLLLSAAERDGVLALCRSEKSARPVSGQFFSEFVARVPVLPAFGRAAFDNDALARNGLHRIWYLCIKFSDYKRLTPQCSVPLLFLHDGFLVLAQRHMPRHLLNIQRVS